MSEIGIKKKLSILKRGYGLCHRLAPTYVMRQCITRAIFTLEQFMNIFLVGMIAGAISGDMDYDALIMVVIIYGVLNLLFDIMQELISKRRGEQLRQGFTFKAKMMIAKKCAELDYVHIENPETHRKKECAESFLYGAGGWGGMPALLDYSGALFKNILNALSGFLICFYPLFLKPSAAGGVMGLVQSVWGAIFVFLVCSLLITLCIKITARQGKTYSDFFADSGYNQEGRVCDYYLDFHKNRYQRGKEIRIYNQSKLLLSEWEKHKSIVVNYDRRQYKRIFASDVIIFSLPVFTELVVYAFIIMRAVGGMYSVAETIVLVMSMNKLLSGISAVLESRSMFLDIVPQNLQYIFDFLDLEYEKYMGTIPTEKRNDNEYEFEFKNVSFKYPKSEEYVLKDINLKWRVGEKMALVGRNGSGKTTLVKLLCRLYEVTEGEITLNGVDIRKYDYEDYMSLFSVVFQDSRLFSFTTAENVATDTEYDKELVKDSVARVGLPDRIIDNVEGCLYKDFDENGLEISGGEAQKLCIARAIYKGAPFIVLDEPTASLDPVSEYEVYTNFNKVVGGSTAIYISHRLSSCRFCDNITVLENGSIVERGSHEELIEKDGAYAKLFLAQAKYYAVNRAF